MLEVKRTLVKSGPELWAEVNDPAALARHLGPFGSVRITHAEPERLVEWEGDRATGAVRLEPSGFGTRVVLTAAPHRAAEVPADPPPEPPAPVVRRGLWARLFRRGRPAPPAPALAPPPPPPPERPPRAEPLADAAALAVLTETLDALGTARHRPFSRV